MTPFSKHFGNSKKKRSFLTGRNRGGRFDKVAPPPTVTGWGVTILHKCSQTYIQDALNANMITVNVKRVILWTDPCWK